MGGQGGGVLVDWIVSLAEGQGYFAQATSVPGVAQRTGATLYYVELIAPRPEGFVGRVPVLSLMPAPGEVDLLIGAELMEAGRAMLRGLASPERTLLIASTHRALAVSEKVVPGDGAGDPLAVLDAAASAARRVVAFDMATVAEQSDSVISAVLFGAIAGAAALPFARVDFETAISRAGIGVSGSLRGFAAGFEAASGGGPARPVGPPAKRYAPPLGPFADCVGAFPAAARDMIATGLSRVVDFQDFAYGAEYLDHVARFAAFDDATCALTIEAAKQIANAMAYDDVIRVADAKTRSGRLDRIRGEVGAAAAQLVSATEYMHPGVAEICGLLPARLGAAVERSRRLAWLLGHVTRGRHVRTTTLRGFLPLYAVAGLRRVRRGNLRHAREMAAMRDWLDHASAVAPREPGLALEILRARRLVKGYSDTRARGGDRFATLMMAAARLSGRADAAAWMGRLREAALRDASGTALIQTWRTVQTFLSQETR